MLENNKTRKQLLSIIEDKDKTITNLESELEYVQLESARLLENNKDLKQCIHEANMTNLELSEELKTKKENFENLVDFKDSEKNHVIALKEKQIKEEREEKEAIKLVNENLKKEIIDLANEKRFEQNLEYEAKIRTLQFTNRLNNYLIFGMLAVFVTIILFQAFGGK